MGCADLPSTAILLIRWHFKGSPRPKHKSTRCALLIRSMQRFSSVLCPEAGDAHLQEKVVLVSSQSPENVCILHFSKGLIRSNLHVSYIHCMPRHIYSDARCLIAILLLLFPLFSKDKLMKSEYSVIIFSPLRANGKSDWSFVVHKTFLQLQHWTFLIEISGQFPQCSWWLNQVRQNMIFSWVEQNFFLCLNLTTP